MAGTAACLALHSGAQCLCEHLGTHTSAGCTQSRNIYHQAFFYATQSLVRDPVVRVFVHHVSFAHP